MKKGNDKLTLSIDKKIKKMYKEFCDKKGLQISKQVELFMIEQIKKGGKNGKVKRTSRKRAKKTR